MPVPSLDSPSSEPTDADVPSMSPSAAVGSSRAAPTGEVMLAHSVGMKRHQRVRAVLRDAGVAGLIAVSTPDDMQAGDYLTGLADGLMGGAIVYLPVEGPPFAFAPPDLTPAFPAIVLQGLESAGVPLWVTDWTFGDDGVPAFVDKLHARLAPRSVVGAVNLAGSALGDYIGTRLPELTVRDLTSEYNHVRAVRIGAELDNVRSASAAAESAARVMTKTIRAGVSEAEVAGIVHREIGRDGITIADIALGSFDGYGAPPAPPSFRTVFNVGNSFDSAWRTRGAPPRILDHGDLITGTIRCWAAGTEAHVQLTVSIGELTDTRRRLATQLGIALHRARTMIRPGLTLDQLHDSIADSLASVAGAASVGAYCYLLNPVTMPTAISVTAPSGNPVPHGGVVLMEGMHVQLNPHVLTDEEMLGVSCGVVVTAHGAEPLNHVSREVNIV